MRVTVLAVGQNKFSYLREGESDYLGRLKHYCRISLVCVRGARFPAEADPARALSMEWEALRGGLPERRRLIALDRAGRPLTSEALAGRLGRLEEAGPSDLCFLVGGPLGLDPAALAAADEVLSLSAMTFTHEMTRLILLEQLYRAFTILRGEKYHK